MSDFSFTQELKMLPRRDRKASATRQNFQTRFSSLLGLEPRLMLAADAGVAASGPVAAEIGDSSTSSTSVQHAASSVQTIVDVVFIDSQVDDADLLTSGIEDAEIVLLSPNTDAIQQITAHLAQRNNLQSVHIISHGQAGALELNGEIVDTVALKANQNLLRSWRNALSPNADILIYGCEVAAESDAFIRILADLTSADVAASSDRTGSVESNANWILERTIGDVQTQVLLSEVVRKHYRATLPVTIHAAGATGEENIELQIDGETVAQWSNIGGDFDSRTFESFTYNNTSAISADQVRVVFTNDLYIEGQIDRNVHVDRIEIDGREYQTEDPSVFSTGTWRPGIGIESGNTESETLHASGYFQFAEPDHSIVIYAAGQTGTETMQLLIDGEVVQEWQNAGGDLESRKFGVFAYKTDEVIDANRIRVAFVNDAFTDGFDRNLVVDRIEIDGVVHQAEADDVISTGTWKQEDGVVTGVRQSEWLHANGFLQFDSFTRTYNGSGNNLENADWGTVGAQLLRIADADYADGISLPGGEYRPSPREISNVVAAQDEFAFGNDRALSVAVHVWGQFIDHDLDLTEPPHSGGEPLLIDVPAGDPFFDPFNTGTAVIRTSRSEGVEGTGTSTSNPLQHPNALTPFLDASMVYGTENSGNLRSYSGGKMILSDGDLLPVDDEGAFFAGDIRAMENTSLTAMHTLFAREHNYWANQLAAAFPDMSDEELYQDARKIVIAEIQSITYNEFLPALLGEGAISSYQGYDANVNPGITTEFSTAAFRFGHTMLNDELQFIANDGNQAAAPIALADAFFNPSVLQQNGIDSSLKFIASVQAQEIDIQVVDSLRNFLFGPPGAGGLDLVSLNIIRGRDHGLADFNTTREAIGLDRVTDFDQITSNVDLQNKLRDLYGTVDNIDLWVGGLAEDHAGDGSLGETFRAIVVDQFERLRDGDRLWFENSFDSDAVHALNNTTLADIIRRNTGVDNIQDDVFLMWGAVEGQLYAGSQDSHSLGFPLEGVWLQLYNGDGELVGETHSGAGGFYRFDQIAEVGAYRVVMRLDGSFSSTGDTHQDVWFSRGNQTLSGIDFLVPDAHQFV